MADRPIGRRTYIELDKELDSLDISLTNVRIARQMVGNRKIERKRIKRNTRV